MLIYLPKPVTKISSSNDQKDRNYQQSEAIHKILKKRKAHIFGKYYVDCHGVLNLLLMTKTVKY